MKRKSSIAKCKMLDLSQKKKGASGKVKIGVVLTEPDDWTANAFLKNIGERGAEALPINLSQLSASISTSDFYIFDANLEDLDAIIVRDVGISSSLEIISFKFDLLRQFENSMIVMNRSTAIQNAANKFFSFYLFKLAHLPIPRTVITSELEVALKTIEKFKIAVAKPIFGSQGKGILKLESSQSQPDSELASKLAALLKERGVLYLQQFVPNPGRDIRVFVVGEEALGAIYRVPRSGSFVSNLSRGGRPFKCELTEEMRELAISASKALGADFAGVDLIEGESGLFLLEVNATPSGKGIKLACGIDVTERIIDTLFERIKNSRNND